MIIKKLNNSYTLKIIDVRNSENQSYVYSIIDTIYNILKNVYNNVDGCNAIKHYYDKICGFKTPKEYVLAILKGLSINCDIDTDDPYEYNRMIILLQRLCIVLAIKSFYTI
jgi:hypothetical protein